MSKACSRCSTNKSLDLFPKKKGTPDGHYSICKDCVKIKNAESYLLNKEKVKTRMKNNREKDPEKAKLANKANYENHKEVRLEAQRQYYEEHKAECKERMKQYDKEYKKRRELVDVEFKIKNRLRSRLYDALNGSNKSDKTVALLGCTISFLHDHLEFQFDDKMTWDNYGSYWHIDHIIPCASFNMSDPEHQRKCFHYSNLQPLEASENRKKSDKLDWVKK